MLAIKNPTSPLPAMFVPAGSQAYRVTDADNWWTLAAKAGVDPWWLIQYNFETRNPAEVNWYLRNRVGCTKTSPDGRNLMFSSSAKPGIIYLPTAQTVRSLKSMEYKSFGIVIEGEPDYQRQVKTTLDWIARSDTGTALLAAIRRTNKEITISPWQGTVCNATASPTSIRDATATGIVVTKGGSSFEQLKEPSMVRDLLGLPKDPMTGTGKGSDAIVRFSPTMFGYGSTGPCSTFAAAPGASPSQVLFHELAHAYRIARGVFNPRPTIAGSTSYTNMEEFFAVVLSNVLISDPTYSSGNRTLRADHAGFNPLAPALTTSRGFVTSVPNRNKMRELTLSEPELSTALKNVKSYFNPFTEPL